jgi:CRP-like cAMP-binding protein
MSRTPLFEDAAPGTVARLAERGTIRRYRRGTYLFHQGDDSPEVFFLLDGRVEISSLSVGGHRQLHTTLDRPQFFGELGVLGGMTRTAAALALDESNVWAVSAPTFLDFLSDEPAASQALLRALARQVQSQEAFVEDLLHLDLKGGSPNACCSSSRPRSTSCERRAALRRSSPTPTWRACAAEAART